MTKKPAPAPKPKPKARAPKPNESKPEPVSILKKVKMAEEEPKLPCKTCRCCKFYEVLNNKRPKVKVSHPLDYSEEETYTDSCSSRTVSTLPSEEDEDGYEEKRYDRFGNELLPIRRNGMYGRDEEEEDDDDGEDRYEDEDDD